MITRTLKAYKKIGGNKNMSVGVVRNQYKYEDIRKDVVYVVGGVATATANYGSIVQLDVTTGEYIAYTGDVAPVGKLGVVVENGGIEAGKTGQILLAGIVKEHTEMGITDYRKNELFISSIYLA